MKQFIFYFLDGTHTVSKGHSVSNAFTNAGYSSGAINAVDFYDEGDAINYTWCNNNKCWNKNKGS